MLSKMKTLSLVASLGCVIAFSATPLKDIEVDGVEGLNEGNEGSNTPDTMPDDIVPTMGDECDEECMRQMMNPNDECVLPKDICTAPPLTECFGENLAECLEKAVASADLTYVLAMVNKMPLDNRDSLEEFMADPSFEMLIKMVGCDAVMGKELGDAMGAIIQAAAPDMIGTFGEMLADCPCATPEECNAANVQQSCIGFGAAYMADPETPTYSAMLAGAAQTMAGAILDGNSVDDPCTLLAQNGGCEAFLEFGCSSIFPYSGTGLDLGMFGLTVGAVCGKSCGMSGDAPQDPMFDCFSACGGENLNYDQSTQHADPASAVPTTFPVTPCQACADQAADPDNSYMCCRKDYMGMSMNAEDSGCGMGGGTFKHLCVSGSADPQPDEPEPDCADDNNRIAMESVGQIADCATGAAFMCAASPAVTQVQSDWFKSICCLSCMV